jgi:hypothetical protein
VIVAHHRAPELVALHVVSCLHVSLPLKENRGRSAQI